MGMNNPKYTFCKVLQKGLYGSIWKVEHKIEKKHYALKIIKNYDEVAMYECEMMSMFSHVNIIDYKEKIKTIDEDGRDLVYIVMELAQSDLFEYFHRGGRYRKITKTIVVNYLKQILDGIEYLHSKKYVHGDLKLENVLLVDGFIKICDFATCTFIKDDNALTQCEKRIGTDGMMAPEMYNGCMITYASDIYSFGVMIDEIIDNSRTRFRNAYLRTISDKCTDSDYKKRPKIPEIRAMLLNVMKNDYKNK